VSTKSYAHSRPLKVLMKDVVSPVPPEEVRAVIRKCLEDAALVNYTRICNEAKIERILVHRDRHLTLRFRAHGHGRQSTAENRRYDPSDRAVHRPVERERGTSWRGNNLFLE